MKVIVREVIVRSSLDDDFYILDTLKKGDSVVVKDKTVYYNGGPIERPYFKCVMSNGDEGYIRQEAVK